MKEQNKIKRIKVTDEIRKRQSKKFIGDVGEVIAFKNKQDVEGQARKAGRTVRWYS